MTTSAVVLRPSSQTPGVAMVMVDCIRAGGLPDGAVNLVVGSTRETYGQVMADARVRKVSLTGSTRVGQQMIRDAADTVKKVSMELGGNAPCIIYDDADLSAALDVCVPTKFTNCGQVCVTPDRFFVHDSLHDEFVSEFAKRAKAIKLGDGLDVGAEMGPLINAHRLDEIDAIVQDAVQAGAKLETGGQRAAGFNAGHFYAPSLRDERLNDDMFDSLDDARRKLALWRYDDNTVRPHSSLGNQTPQQARRTLEQFEGSAPGALAQTDDQNYQNQTRRHSL